MATGIKTGGRDFEEGNPGGGKAARGGRPALPDWYKDRTPGALLMTLAAATGECPDIPGVTTQAHKDMAAGASLELRAACAKDVRESVYGKATQAVEHTGETGVVVAGFRVEIVDPKQPQTLTMDDGGQVTKHLNGEAE